MSNPDKPAFEGKNNNALGSCDVKPGKAITGLKKKAIENAFRLTGIAAALGGSGAAIAKDAPAQNPPFPTPLVQEGQSIESQINPQLKNDQGISPDTVKNILNQNFPPLTLEASQVSLNPYFQKLWNETDGQMGPDDTWSLGPEAFATRKEPYDQAPGGQREVAYYDKARLEINNPNADPNSEWYITTGLLTSDMIKGRVQVGDDRFLPFASPEIPVAGDPDDINGPTYKTFNRLLEAPALPEGETIVQTINRQGQVGIDENFRKYGVKAGEYIQETKHRVANIFDPFLEKYSRGKHKYFLSGLPISEPYWSKVKVGGVEKDVLIQPFERRVLTYTPSNPAKSQVEWGNVGRHYDNWVPKGGGEIPGAEERVPQSGKGWVINYSKGGLVEFGIVNRDELDKIEGLLQQADITKPIIVDVFNAEKGLLAAHPTVNIYKTYPLQTKDAATGYKTITIGKIYVDETDQGSLIAILGPLNNIEEAGGNGIWGAIYAQAITDRLSGMNETGRIDLWNKLSGILWYNVTMKINY